MLKRLLHAIAARHLEYLQRHAISELHRVCEMRAHVAARAREAHEELDAIELRTVLRLNRVAVRRVDLLLKRGRSDA